MRKTGSVLSFKGEKIKLHAKRFRCSFYLFSVYIYISFIRKTISSCLTSVTKLIYTFVGYWTNKIGPDADGRNLAKSKYKFLEVDKTFYANGRNIFYNKKSIHVIISKDMFHMLAMDYG